MGAYSGGRVRAPVQSRRASDIGAAGPCLNLPQRVRSDRETF